MSVLQIEIPEGSAIHDEEVRVGEYQVITLPVIGIRRTKNKTVYHLSPEAHIIFWEEPYLDSIQTLTVWTLDKDIRLGVGGMDGTNERDFCFRVRSIRLLPDFTEEPIGIEPMTIPEIMSELERRLPQGEWELRRGCGLTRESPAGPPIQIVVSRICHSFSHSNSELVEQISTSAHEVFSELLPDWEMTESYIDHDSCYTHWTHTETPWKNQTTSSPS